jgi:hypothetical protein
MEPVLLKQESLKQSSFRCWRNANPYIHNPWHFHKDHEITYIENGRGSLFVGDSIQSFGPGDIVLLGSFLPHEFHSNNHSGGREDYESKSISIHFKKEFPGNKFYEIPENRKINSLIGASVKGLLFYQTPAEMRRLITNIVNRNPHDIEKVLTLFKILSLMSKSKDVQYLASSGFIESIDKTPNDRINDVYKYVHLNFKNSIPLSEISNLVNMTQTSFC